MRLLEFEKDQILLKDTIRALGARFKLERVGGPTRVYLVGNELGVVYLVDNGPKAVGLSWARGSNTVSRVFVWSNFNASHPPDLEAPIPEGHGPSVMEAIANLVQHPHQGIVESVVRQVGENEFVRLMKNEFDDESVTLPTLQSHALRMGIAIPDEVMTKPDYRNGDEFKFTAAVNQPEERAPKPFIIPKATSAKFEVPGVEITSKKIEQAFAETNDQPTSMEEQYEELAEKVKLVASNKSSYIKALLITGAPSSGKTFTVMKTIKEMGLQEGSDYIVVKGSITDAALYTTFIEQIDALTIFDDCDSVVETKDGKNMLKNALDTYAVRDIGRPNANSINTKHMKPEERDSFVDAISRIFRGSATEADIKRFDNLVPRKAVKKDDAERVYDPTGDDDLTPDERYEKLTKFLSDDDADESRLVELQNFFKRKPPNRIDFKGRIIFISNMDENEWDSAILTRAFRQNMNFADGEMLDFIERIKNSIDAPNLTPEQKDEVMAYIRERHDAGQLKSRVNFRLIQQGFDLRLCGPWRRMIDAL